MQTTMRLIVDKSLKERAEKKAKRLGVSLDEFVTEGLREFIYINRHLIKNRRAN